MLICVIHGQVKDGEKPISLLYFGHCAFAAAVSAEKSINASTNFTGALIPLQWVPVFIEIERHRAADRLTDGFVTISISGDQCCIRSAHFGSGASCTEH